MAENKKEIKKKNNGMKYFILTIIMFLIFLFTLIGGIIFLDIIGVLNLSKVISKDSNIAKLPYIGNYISYSYNIHLTEEERLKNTMLKYQEILENKRKEIELKELAVTKREEDVKVLEKELLTKEKELQQKEEELIKKEEILKKLNAEYSAKDENITKFSNIYAKMQPNSVAIAVNNMELDIVSKIFEKMDEKKVALILDELSKINPLRVKEIVETMTKKNEVPNVSKNTN
ncbi:hypothetical protein EV215_1477 [Hypnocyclicus thermotrophus]|uniref:Flagellar motility protein MotE (MotC chaperone) n=1 Tax=Hypnocyclicus thermotrophus TaxID=1627895 RepID=A0AA46I5N8_9FUSO|nr:hypothetical protein [Hypnocyclicus thermotrophus]TDT69135.1 hypothetical protein EV215_1477 [Hypnocyclicus thermotrophus]